MAPFQLPQELVLLLASLADLLHAHSAPRLLPLCIGVLFSRGRRTVTSWLRAAARQHDFQRYYYFLGSLGRKTRPLASQLLHAAVRQLGIAGRVLLGLDDTPTKRYGPCVQGAGIHHNPTPGPADQTFLYGHIWVTIALIAQHPLWGTIALPLWALLYVRRRDIAKVPRHYRWKFQTKLQLAAEMVEWVAWCLGLLKLELWIVVDGAYAKRPFLRRALAAGAVVVSRLRKDANLRSVPKTSAPGQRRPGRPRKYGAQRISLAKRAGQGRGWQTGEFVLYGQRVSKTYKTFLATYPPVGGLIRVVLVQEENGWVAFFCTKPDATVADILEAVADRSSVEQVFHDVKEVHGTGQQQLRNVWANVAAFNLILWMHTLIELWAWRKPQSELCDRSRSPWDKAARRPSHADRRNALRRESLGAGFFSARAVRTLPRKIRKMVEMLLNLAV